MPTKVEVLILRHTREHLNRFSFSIQKEPTILFVFCRDNSVNNSQIFSVHRGQLHQNYTQRRRRRMPTSISGNSKLETPRVDSPVVLRRTSYMYLG